MYCKISTEIWLIFFGVTLAITLRACTTLHPHSGEAAPPMYGDFEAQRHWMEITTNLPLQDWYRNTSDNNLLYWGLDYPPLTAYHMYLCGKIAGYINENFTKLHDSRGYESETLKFFMRSTVLLADVLLYIPALVIYYFTCVSSEKNQDRKFKKKKESNNVPMNYSISLVISLLYPGIILIDHGHFQYNCVSLAFLTFATTAVLHKRNILASVMFCLALNYKQMELYHALPFFLYLLSSCVPKPGQSAISGVLKLITIGVTVIVTFGVIWLPFLFDYKDAVQVFVRLFPVDRGVFEDKVSNIWCALNVLYKFKTKFDNHQMMRLCLFTTLSALFPSSVDLFLRPNSKKFVLALINSSLTFFLFSFQVHEKSILLVAIPVLLYFPYDPFICFWFLFVSVFSMVPLLVKDNLTIAFISLTVFYIVCFKVSVQLSRNMEGFSEFYKIFVDIVATIFSNSRLKSVQIKNIYRRLKNKKDAMFMSFFSSALFLSLLSCTVLFLMSICIDPPKRYPDLFPLLISVHSCVHFLGFFLYFNVKQLQIPQEFEDIKHVRLKTD